jgi:hypothetical protein
LEVHMLVKILAAFAATQALALSGAVSNKVAAPTAGAVTRAPALPCEGGSCPLAADCGPDCPLCPECPFCEECPFSGGAKAKASVKAGRSKPAACDQCPSGSKCCAK